jgi:iron complex transport system substrate-binding protein
MKIILIVMKRTRHLHGLAILCLMLIGWIAISPVSGETLQAFPADTVSPEYAEGFSVEYHDTYKRVTVLSPWRGSNETFTYLLVEPGTVPPDPGSGETVIEIPSRRFVSLSTTYLPYLPILGETEALVGVEDASLVNTPEIVSRINEGYVRDVAGAGSGMASGVDIEVLIDLDPDLVMTYATGTPEYDMHPKLKEAGIPVVLNGEYMETDPLGRAEWIKFVSVFFNKEKEANEYFDRIEAEYLALKDLAATEEKPTVFLNNNYRGTWYMAGGESYVACFLSDAGAGYFWADDTTTGSIPLDFEVVYDRALGADYWLNPGTVRSMEELLAEDARYADFGAVGSGQVYNNNARVNDGGGNDYWESGVVHPEIVLKDLLKIFHPDLVPDHDLVYYQQLKSADDSPGDGGSDLWEPFKAIYRELLKIFHLDLVSVCRIPGAGAGR